MNEKASIIKKINEEISNIEKEISERFNCNFTFLKLREKLIIINSFLLEQNINRKDILIKFVELNKEIFNAEKSLEFPKYYEWTWFYYFSDLRWLVSDLYEEIFNDDNKEYSIIEFIERIIDDWMIFYDLDLVPEGIKNKYKVKLGKWTLKTNNNDGLEVKQDDKTEEESYILSTWLIDEYPQANLKFNNINEILNFVERKEYYRFN